MRISDWSSDVCSSDLHQPRHDLVADAEEDRRVEHVVGEADRGRERDDVAGEQRQLHARLALRDAVRSEEHTSELQSLMRISYAVFCLKKKKTTNQNNTHKL